MTADEVVEAPPKGATRPIWLFRRRMLSSGTRLYYRVKNAKSVKAACRTEDKPKARVNT